MTIDTLRWTGTIPSRSDAVAIIQHPGDICMVLRGHPRLFVMRCPCSCGEDIIINIDPQAGPAWRFREPGPRLTIFPSVWRDTGCQSHFIVWSGNIWWAGAAWEQAKSTVSDAQILAACRPDAFRSAEEIAQQLETDPWSVLVACQRLARAGRLLEGPQQRSGAFRRT